MVWYFIAGWIAGVIGCLMFGYVMSKKVKNNGEDKRS